MTDRKPSEEPTEEELDALAERLAESAYKVISQIADYIASIEDMDEATLACSEIEDKLTEEFLAAKDKYPDDRGWINSPVRLVVTAAAMLGKERADARRK